MLCRRSNPATPAGSDRWTRPLIDWQRLAWPAATIALPVFQVSVFLVWLFTAVGNMHCCMALSSLMAIPASKLTVSRGRHAYQ